MEENNTGGWSAAQLEIPVISIVRGGVMYPMPQLDTTIIRNKKHWWSRGGWFTVLRQYGQDRNVMIGPWRTKEQARQVERDMYAWYSSVYNVVIRTYKATERNRK